MKQPVARVEVVRDTYFGTTIEDPYRWMEDWKSEEMASWIKEQAAYSRAYLDALPERETLLARIKELDNASTSFFSFSIAGGNVFYYRRDPGEKLARLMVRFAVNGEEKTLFDPNTLEGAVHTAVDWYFPSRDGNHVAYGLSQGGSENSTLYVLEVESGKTLDLAISRTHLTTVNWLEDHRSFLYHRFPQRAPDAPLTDHYRDGCTYLHRLGDDPDKDPVVFGRGINPRVEIARDDTPLVFTRATSEWMIGEIRHGDRNELTLYAAPRSALADPADCPWTKIADLEDEVTGYAWIGDTIYFTTHKDAERYKVIATSLKKPDIAHAPIVVPESQAVIEEIRIAGDYLLTRDLDGGIGRIRRIPLSGGEPEQLPLPFEGTIIDLTNEAANLEVLLYLSSWLVSPRLYRCDANRGSITDTSWIPPSPIDVSKLEVREVFAPAQDGVQIPLSIIHAKGLKLDGNNPTLLMGYGSYGISIKAFFDPSMLAWYERGGVFAVAHMRGGGEYGEGWHKAGKMLNKHTTIDDFIACGEYLVKQGFTRPECLAGEGGSAGGIPTGGALVRRPDLWAVMLMFVPVTNGLRFELTENGPPNVQEFGSVTTEDGFKGLSITDSYARVKDGTHYPAVLLTGGFNDPRVVVWQPAKMAARLQAATASGKPVLLRVDFQAGHGMGSTRQQVYEERADAFAFVLQQCGKLRS